MRDQPDSPQPPRPDDSGPRHLGYDVTSKERLRLLRQLTRAIDTCLVLLSFKRDQSGRIVIHYSKETAAWISLARRDLLIELDALEQALIEQGEVPLDWERPDWLLPGEVAEEKLKEQVAHRQDFEEWLNSKAGKRFLKKLWGEPDLED